MEAASCLRGQDEVAEPIYANKCKKKGEYAISSYMGWALLCRRSDYFFKYFFSSCLQELLQAKKREGEGLLEQVREREKRETNVAKTFSRNALMAVVEFNF